MQVSAEVLRMHLAYSAWATGRLLEAAGKLSPEEWTRDFHTADRSVLGTLAHTCAADRIWLERMQGAPCSGFRTDLSAEELQAEWPLLHEHWQAWVRDLTDEAAAAALAYKDMAGREWNQPVWQLVLHVVNHATHHRGQVSGFLRAMGHVPPKLDLVHYYRELKA